MKYNSKSTQINCTIGITMIIIIILNHFLRWPLYEKGLNIIYNLQSIQSVFVDWFFIIITMIIDPSVVLLITVIIMGISRRK